jgi:hypothetical protein
MAKKAKKAANASEAGAPAKLPAEPDIEKLFAPFLKAHDYSRISKLTFGEHERHIIYQPWNDDSIALLVGPDNPKPLADALNALILPQRFSAIWHKDTKDFEVVWTAFKLSGPAIEIADRKFDFRFGNKVYKCEFGDSSPRLMEIAHASIQIKGTETGYRNLISLEMYSMNSGQDRLDKPRSFWIRNVEWDEDFVVDFAYHLNFYMSYFDDRTTKIIIHPRTEVSTVKPQERFIAGKFPSNIQAKVIDPNILHFWQAAHGADDQSKSFLYYYRLVEYASTTHIDREARSTVRRLLARPNALDDVTAITEQLMLAAQSTKKDDEQKIGRLLEDTVDRKQLTQEIEKNVSLFIKEAKFEGGFTLEPLIGSGHKAESFDLSKFAKHIKDIRNALSHGRDIRTQMVIIPTQKNFDLLQPWVTLMCVVAGQVVLFKGVT